MGNTFDWIVASGAFGAASSWSVGEPGGVSGPPTSSDYAEIDSDANVYGNGVADNLDINAAVTISSPLTTTVSGSATIGANGVGSVTVSSTWTAAGYLQVGGYPDNGNAYAGTLTIDAGGVVDNTTTDGMTVGANPGGTGTLIVQGGGKLTTQYLTLGGSAGASGVATLSGAGSTVTIAGAITVGNFGNGQLTISDGGSLFTNGTTQNNFYDTIGNLPGSVGSVTVTGAGSTWKSANNIQVGEGVFYGGGGTATLSATDGGFVQSAQGISIYPGGTISVDATSVIESGATGGAEAGFLTLDANGGYLYGAGTIDADVIDNNAINAIDGGPMTINGAVTGDGSMQIGTDGDLVLNGPATATGGVNFYNWYGTLALDEPGLFSSQVTNFMPGDTIDLTSTPYDASNSTYSYTYGSNGTPNALVVTEGGDTSRLNVNSTVPLSGRLKLEQDASGSGTDIVFASTPASPFNIWSTLPNFYSTSSGPVNGEDWATSNPTDGGNPLWVDTETPSSTYSPGVAGNYTIVMTTQDWLGDQQPLVTVATDTDIVDPFGHNASSIGNLASAVIFSSNTTTGNGAVVYWQASATPGDYALELQPTTTTYQTAPSAGPSTVLTGTPVTMIAAVANPTNWTFSNNATSLVFAYTATAGSTTENIWFQAFTSSGVATSPAVEAAAGVSDSTQYYVGYDSGNYYYRYTIVNGSSTGLYGGSFDVTTGALGTLQELVSAPSFTSFTGVGSRTLSSGNSLRFLEGIDNGQAVIQTFVNSDSTPTASFLLSNADDHFGTADVFDPNDGQLDYTVLAYTDNNQVHLELLDENGFQIGSDFIVPGLTSFDRIHTLTGDTLDSDRRVEIDYTAADPSGGTEIEGVIYSTAGSPYVYTIGSAGSNEYDGSPFDDTISYAPGVDIVDGGGGTDTFVATNFTASQVSVTINSAGNVILSDGAGDVDTLRRFSTLDLAGAAIAISGNVLTQNNSDATKVVSTFNIGGNASATTVANYDAASNLVSEVLTDVSASVTASNATVYLNSAQTQVVGGSDTVDATSGSGNAAALSDTGGNWDLVNGSSETIDLTSAQAAVAGGGNTVNLVAGSDNALTVADTGGDWDSVNGAPGTVYLTSGQAQVNGGGYTLFFDSGSANAVTVANTSGDWDSVNGSGGTIYLASGQAQVNSGGDTANFVSGSDNALTVVNSGGDWDLVNGSSGTIYLASGQAQVNGGGDAVNFVSGSANAVTVANTSGNWDSVNGSGGTVYLASGQAQVNGGGDAVNFVSGSANAVTIAGTGGDWDSVNGSGGTVYLASGQAEVNGGGDTVDFVSGSGNAVTVANTQGNWDSVNGSDGTLYLISGQTVVTGGSDTVNFYSGAGNAATLAGTAGNTDSVNGSNGTVYLTSAQASVAGSDDTINFTSGSGNAVTISDTSAGEDTVNGSNGTVTLANAQASVGGGGDTIDFQGRSSSPGGNGGGAPNMAQIHDTGGNADLVNASAGTIYLTHAQASVSGEGDTVYLDGSTVTQNGAADLFVFEPSFGVDKIHDFASTDSLRFSTADFANWSALLGHISQSGANTLITLDATDTVTLTGVTATSLSASQFQFSASP